MSKNIPHEQWTYKKKALWLNSKSDRCRNCGGTHRFMTRGCKPVMVPDHWLDDGNYTWVSAPLLIRLTKRYTKMNDGYKPQPETPSPAKVQT